jgi:hypothetical protein
MAGMPCAAFGGCQPWATSASACVQCTGSRVAAAAAACHAVLHDQLPGTQLTVLHVSAFGTRLPAAACVHEPYIQLVSWQSPALLTASMHVELTGPVMTNPVLAVVTTGPTTFTCMLQCMAGRSLQACGCNVLACLDNIDGGQ